MARGFMSGIVSGLVVGAAGLATVSVLTGPGGEPPVVPAAPVEVVEPEVEAPVEAPVIAPVETPVPDSVPAPVAAPVPDPASEATPDPDPAPTSAPDEDAAIAPEQPITEIIAAGDLPAPDEGQGALIADDTAASDMTSVTPAPVAPAPDSEATPVGADPTASPMLEAMEQSLAGVAPAEGEGASRPVPSDDVLATVIPDPATSPMPAEAAPAQSEAPVAAAATDPMPEPMPEPMQDPLIGPQTQDAPQPEAQTPDVAADQLQPPAPIKSAPVTQIGDMAPNVTTNRLPTIGGGEAEVTADNGDANGDTAVAASDLAPAMLAIERNAAEFENPEGRPLMAVALLDVPDARAGLGDLKNLPFAVSFVVDAGAADAAQAIAFYRAAGAEVIVAVPLPEGATPADVEVTLQAQAPVLSDAVAVMMAAGFQAAGPSARQVAVVLAEQGLGLVSVPQGLNTGHKSAVKEGVPAGLVFRDLDNDGQTAAVIRRFMDNAAFKARQEKGVIMLGHARVETVQALIEWALGNRAKSVALAPLSAVLLDR